MCILIYHENGGRFNASFQEDRASISSQANQKSAGYHCILAVFFHYYYGRYPGVAAGGEMHAVAAV